MKETTKCPDPLCKEIVKELIKFIKMHSNKFSRITPRTLKVSKQMMVWWQITNTDRPWRSSRNTLGRRCERSGVQFPVARASLRFNSRASTLAGKQCLAMRCTIATNYDRIMRCSWNLWFGTQAPDLAFDNKRTIWGAVKNPWRGLSTRLANLPGASRC